MIEGEKGRDSKKHQKRLQKIIIGLGDIQFIR